MNHEDYWVSREDVGPEEYRCRAIPEDRCFKDGVPGDDVAAHGDCLAHATEEKCGENDADGCVWKTVLDAWHTVSAGRSWSDGA